MVCMSLSSSLVQSYYAFRVWRFGKNNLLLLSIFVLILFQFASNTAWVILMLQADSYIALLRLRPLKLAITLLSTVVDVIITTSLVLLWKSRTGLNQSNSLINKMIIFFVTTAMTPSICAIGGLISLAAFPDTLIYGTFAACIGTLYTGSFIATLNTRRSLTQEADTQNTYCHRHTILSTCIYTSPESHI
ncbi:hypothetical protein APHAL10511_008062 [Amanita phalloides]|nr:hypothetical protein APHAL10511_008062 [Amanita phalloides]